MSVFNDLFSQSLMEPCSMWANLQTKITSRSCLSGRKGKKAPTHAYTHRFAIDGPGQPFPFVSCLRMFSFFFFLKCGELFILFRFLFYMLTHILYTVLCRPSKSSKSFPGEHLTPTSEQWRTELWPVKVAHNAPCGLLSVWKSHCPLCCIPLGLPGIHMLKLPGNCHSPEMLTTSSSLCITIHVLTCLACKFNFHSSYSNTYVNKMFKQIVRIDTWCCSLTYKNSSLSSCWQQFHFLHKSCWKYFRDSSPIWDYFELNDVNFDEATGACHSPQKKKKQKNK